jgi:hypothetical protein
VEASESLQGAYQGPPYLVFCEVSFFFFVFDDLLVQVTITRVVHYDAKGFTLINKRLLVTYNVFVLDRSQDSDLIKCVLLFFLTQILK